MSDEAIVNGMLVNTMQLLYHYERGNVAECATLTNDMLILAKFAQPALKRFNAKHCACPKCVSGRAQN